MGMTIKKNDTVVVIAGKEKGKTGKVLAVSPDSNRVLVDGINVVSKHKKARSQQEQSGIIKKSAPIDASNVMVVCPTCGKATRVAHNEINGKKVRVCKKCTGSLDKEFVKVTKKEAKKKVEEIKATEPKKSTKKVSAKAENVEEVKTEEVKATAKKTTTTKTTATKTAAKKETAPKAEPKAKATTKATTTKKSKETKEPSAE